MKERFTEADMGREDVQLKQTHERTHLMKDSSLTTCMYWSALHCVVELHLSGLHRKKHTKKFLVVCCSFLPLPQTPADWMQMLRQDRAKAEHMEDM